jgi:hypothetical protein
MFKKFQALGKAISSVKPNVPKTQIEKKIRNLKIGNQKLKGSKAKLDQTIFEVRHNQPITFKKNKSKTLSNSQKARKGLKGGSDFPDLSGDGKTTMQDILIGRGVIPKPKNKKKMVAKKTKTPMEKAIKKNKKKII